MRTPSPLPAAAYVALVLVLFLLLLAYAHSRWRNLSASRAKLSPLAAFGTLREGLVCSRQLRGSLLVILVAALWTGSSITLQIVYDYYYKPLLLSYVSFSLQMVTLCSYPSRAREALGASVSWLGAALRGKAAAASYARLSSLTASGGARAPDPGLRAVGAALRLASMIVVATTLFNASLGHTSITSATMLSSSSQVWTLIFSAVRLGELLTPVKLVSIGMTLLGVFLVVSGGGGRKHAVVGGADDVWVNIACMALIGISAMLYGAYAVQIKVEVPSEKVLPVPFLFGLMGLLTFLLGWPVLLLAHAAGVETFEAPSREAALLALANGLFATVLANMLLARATVLASPLVVVVGLSLSIPLALASDVWRHEARLSLTILLGSLCVWLGFVGVSTAKTIGSWFC
uniref:EamA domain-containing protein n=1 Tax=Calcidiscus leptoporus TaxID=127549 RepID=A0A7S0J9F3_9EUKA|mmetsp:Transcript_46411/g.107914  ORF Transcript_46411/g.107914 Transcript_46411/m.107914 type:complete len:403 (+) Transcript_46411:31-1239(+)